MKVLAINHYVFSNNFNVEIRSFVKVLKNFIGYDKLNEYLNSLSLFIRIKRLERILFDRILIRTLKKQNFPTGTVISNRTIFYEVIFL